MGVKWKTVKDDFPKVEKAVKALNGRTVNVGVLKGEHAWLAGIHEYGCTIQVTPKMRAWFARQGYPLKKTTTVIKIPERSFIRAGFDACHEEVIKESEQMMPDVLIGTMSVDAYCKEVGLALASRIKDFARDLKDPANSGMTADMKGSSNPLVDTGEMIGGITFEVEK